MSVSGEALLWSGGCSVTHGRQLQFLWCLWNQLGEGRNRAPSCSSGSRPLPVQPSGRWHLGTDQIVRTSTASTPSWARPTAVTCSRCPREPKFSFGHCRDQRHQGGEWGSPSSRGSGSAVTSVTLCLYGPHLNTNAADSCSHTQTPSPLPMFSAYSSSPRASQGPASSYKNPQDQRGTQWGSFQSSHTQSHHSGIQLCGDPKIIEL